MVIDNFKSFMDFVESEMKDEIYNHCKDGKCSQCGNCCSNFLPMSDKEIKIIHRYIQKNNITESKHLLPVASKFVDMLCPFLDNRKTCKKCRIYPVRPKICKAFICDNKTRAKEDRNLITHTRKIVNVREEFFNEVN